MDLAKLSKIVVDIGAPLLGGAIGGPAGALATTALKELANALGAEATAEDVAAKIEADPSGAASAARAAEDRMFDLWTVEQRALAKAAEVSGPWALFKDGWRPALCWSLVLLWLWGLIIAPMLAVYARPMAALPVDTLLAFSTVVLTVLGGGHTAKAIWGQRMAGGKS